MAHSKQTQTILTNISNEILRRNHLLIPTQAIPYTDEKGVEWFIVGLRHKTKACTSWQYTFCDLYRQKSEFGDLLGELKEYPLRNLPETTILEIGRRISEKDASTRHCN